ncbi:MAG TPA: hypothetical protein PKE12_02415 [Kiritimatiellia bacterium]|nr:hypothetical protein [Kiritimatiellia bacterium]
MRMNRAPHCRIWMAALAMMCGLWTGVVREVAGAGYSVSSCGGVAACSGNFCYCCDPVGVVNGGNCVWYTWNRRCQAGEKLTWCTDAHKWAADARSRGWPVCDKPKVGAIGVYSGQHVGYVDAIEGDYVWTREQACWGYSGVTYVKRHKSYWDLGYIYFKNDTCEPTTGNLKVTINPAEARTAGAQWRRTGTTTWRNSGYTETGLSTGSKTVEFKAISNWDKPANASITVGAGQTATMTKSYVRHTGSLSVTINPADARTAGAQWRRTGTTTWRNSGYTESGLNTGSYTVEFSALASPWLKPANLGVTISKGASTSPSVRYNRPPTLVAPGSNFVHVGSLLTIPVTASDADADAATLSLVGAPSGATLAATGAVGAVRFTPGPNQAGAVYAPTLRAVDALGATGSLVIAIHVGTPPQIQPLAPVRARVGELLAFSVLVSEPNGDAVALSLQQGPAGAVFDPGDGRSGLFQFTPDVAQGGELHDLVFTASDADGVHTSVVPLIVGAPPVMEPLADVAVLAGQTASFTVAASDPNGDPKTFVMSGAPPDATLAGTGDTREFSHTALVSEKGRQFLITFEVSEIDGSHSRSMTLRVQGPPEFTAIPPQRIAVTNLLELVVQAVDPDGDAMSFSMSNAPPGAVFEPGESGGVFRYTPTPEEGANNYTARFYAAAADGVGELEVPILVGVPPELSAPSSLSVAKYNTLEFGVQASDANDDPLTLTASPLPPNAEFVVNGNTGAVQFTPAAFQGDQTYTVVVTASDGLDGAATREVTIQVLDDDMYEQNDLREQAVDFNAFRGLYRPAKQADDDWYFIDLPFGRQRISAALQFAPDAEALRLLLINEQGATVGQSTGADSSAALQLDSPFFGRHYLLVQGDDKGRGYALTWDHADSWDGCTGADDVYAPNHSLATAAAVEAGQWLSAQLGIGLAGEPDWFAVDIPPGEEALSITGRYGQVSHPLHLEVYDPHGARIGLATGVNGVVAWSGALEMPGTYAVRVAAVDEPACIPYDLIAVAAERTNQAVEFLSGRYVRLPVAAAGQPGRWLAPDPSEGARFNPDGTGGRAGADVWGNVPALANQVIGVNGAVIRTNGIQWFTGPVVTRMNEGTMRRLAVEGEPVEGLQFRRELELEDGDTVVVVRDRVENRTAAEALAVLSMESLNPTPDYPFAELRTSNDVTSVFGGADLVMASSTRDGQTMALGSADPAAVLDASFLSRLNPYTVLTSPGDPNGAVANLSLKLLLNHGTLAPGQSREARWYLVFAGDSSAAADHFQRAVMREEWADDLFEPNDEAGSAADLRARAGEWIRAIQANDDWYALQVPIGVQDVQARLKFDPARGGMSMSLYTADGWLLCTSTTSVEGAVLSCVAPAHGVLALKVSGDDAGQVYDLHWSATSSWAGCGGASDDPFEPNNSGTNARALLPDAWAALQAGAMLSAGDEDWYELDVTPERVRLTITCVHHAAHGDLALELYAADGQLLHAVDTSADEEVLVFTVPREGPYHLRVVPPAGGATCNPYDLHWSGEPAATSPAAEVIHLYGHYIFLPIRVVGEPGRFLAPDQTAGLRYDQPGKDGGRGVDIWRQLTLPAAHYIGWNGAAVVTNGKQWAVGPTVEKLSLGSANHARISGWPATGLYHRRDVRFLDHEHVITIEDQFRNEGVSVLQQLVTMDAFDPNPDFSEGVVNTRNYVLALFERQEMALAEALQCGLTMALASESPYAVPDASFLSRQNPYTVLGAPNRPSGQEANFSLKMVMNYGVLEPGATVTGIWRIVVAGSRAEAIARWRDTAPDKVARMDVTGTGVPDWWEVAHFGGPVDPDGDADGDGMKNRDEFWTGTDPWDAKSVFQLNVPGEAFPAGPVLQWNVEPGRRATLLFGTNLWGPFHPVPQAPREPGAHSITHQWTDAASPVFYFLQLDEPHE